VPVQRPKFHRYAGVAWIEIADPDEKL
jgi:hypothetical protein